MGRAQNVRYAVLSLDRESLHISLLGQLFVSAVLVDVEVLLIVLRCQLTY